MFADCARVLFSVSSRGDGFACACKLELSAIVDL